MQDFKERGKESKHDGHECHDYNGVGLALAPMILRPGVDDGGGQQQWGVMTVERWQAFVDFLLEHGIIRDREGKVATDVDVPALFTNEFLTEDA